MNDAEYEIAKQEYLKSLKATAVAFKRGTSKACCIAYLKKAAQTVDLAKNIKQEDLKSLREFL